MKRLFTITLASLLISSLTSCFMFQKHQTCPAYTQLDKKVEKEIVKEDVSNTTIINS